MKISCPACAAKYSIADEKVSDRLAKIRCRKCSATIVIDGKANPPSVYTAAGEATTEASDDASDSQAAGLQFTVDFGEGDQRTMSVPEIVAAYNASQITQDTYLWADGFADWKPLAEVEEVVAALNAGGAPAPAAAAPWASAAASPARTAARTAGRAPAPDLFGGIDAAGSEDDVATSAPDHASAARGGGGGGGGGLGGSAGGGSGTGARNESSVLFSLSALTSAASRPSSRPVAPATASSGSANREDSGLIDLKALTAAATKSEAAAAVALPTAPLISPLAASPLGIASPLGGGLTAPATDYGAPQAKNKTGLYIGGGIAVAAIAAVAIVFMLRPPPPPPAAAPVAAAPAPAPAPTPAPTPEVTATPPSTGTPASEEAPKAGAKTGGGGIKRGGAVAPKKGGAAASPAPAEAPAAAPKPKRNPCGCAAGDLQCAMRCAAG